MKTILIAFALCLLTSAAMAQATVFSTNSTLEKPSWFDEIAEKDGSVMAMKTGRLYKFSRGALIESASLPDGQDFTNVFDFDNRLMYHKGSRTSAGGAVVSFSEINPARIGLLSEYACYMTKGLRQYDMISFYEDYCGGGRR